MIDTVGNLVPGQRVEIQPGYGNPKRETLHIAVVWIVFTQIAVCTDGTCLLDYWGDQEGVTPRQEFDYESPVSARAHFLAGQ